jgi:hypothetical protein
MLNIKVLVMSFGVVFLDFLSKPSILRLAQQLLTFRD